MPETTADNQQPASPVRRIAEHTLHPLLFFGTLAAWQLTDNVETTSLLLMLGAQLLLRVCERAFPAYPTWRQSGGQIAAIIGISLVALILYGVIRGLYEATIFVWLANLRTEWGIAIWPTAWPGVLQVLLAFFISDLIYYWVHRAEHRWTALWRMTGHGFHHAFGNLHAINFQTTHPFELFLLTLPAILVGALLGAPAAVVLGSTMLILINASFTHANFHSRAGWLGLVITNSNHHSRHHSDVFEESNTNFACNAIIWDRLFGTFSEGRVQRTGVGPTEPGTWQKYLMPFREPTDIQTSPRSRAA